MIFLQQFLHIYFLTRPKLRIFRREMGRPPHQLLLLFAANQFISLSEARRRTTLPMASFIFHEEMEAMTIHRRQHTSFLSLVAARLVY